MDLYRMLGIYTCKSLFDCFPENLRRASKLAKLHPVFEIQHDVLFWWISVKQLPMTNRTQNVTYHLLTIRANVATLHF